MGYMKAAQEESRIEMKCKDCVFVLINSGRGFCRRYPPTGCGTYPVVDIKYNCCGEFANSITTKSGGVILFENITKICIWKGDCARK